MQRKKRITSSKGEKEEKNMNNQNKTWKIS